MEENVKMLMGDEKADMVFFDPPYGMAYKSNGWDSKNQDVLENRTDKKIIGDEDFSTAKKAIELIPKFFNEEGHLFVWCRWDSFEAFRNYLEEFSEVKGNIVWDKGDAPGMGDLACSFGSNEMAVHSIIGRRKLNKRINSVWRQNRLKGLSMIHPTQKPIEVIEPAIIQTTDKGMTVIDFFLGSGSTLIACEKTNRKCYGMEIDPHYIDVIVTRYSEFTKQKENIFLEREGKIIPYGDLI